MENLSILSKLIVRELQNHEDIPYFLLLLADPSKESIDKYIQDSKIYVAILNNQIVGIYVLLPIKQNAEIKNIAVIEDFQGQGIGKFLLNHAIVTAQKNYYQKLYIGTGNSSIQQLYLYQKQGFEFSQVFWNFFIENYPEPIFENGIQCKHFIMLEKNINTNFK